MSTNLLKITTGYIHIDKTLKRKDEVTLVIQGTVKRVIADEDEFSEEDKNIYEVKGTIAEVRDVQGSVISSDDEHENI